MRNLMRFFLFLLSFALPFSTALCSPPANFHFPKIYDAFLFYNELEVLEIKLNELYDHVDYFVLVESVESFRGKPKPLYFEENKQKFSKFLDKIIHIVVTDRFKTEDPWEREYFQRNQILRGLAGCDDQDIVIIEDLDEIIRASKIPEIIAPLQNDQLPYVPCVQTLYHYYLNRCGNPDGTGTIWQGSVVAKYANIKRFSPQGIRDRRDAVFAVADAGWHFTYMGGSDRVVNKIENFSHAEFDDEMHKRHERIRRDSAAMKLVEIDASYPRFVQDHISYFESLGFIDCERPLE